MQLNSNEISDLIKDRISKFNVSTEARNEGTIVSVRDGIITINGLADVMQGEMIEQVGMPWHFGFNGLATGGTANMLTTAVGDANTTIPEYKAFLCNIEKGGLKS